MEISELKENVEKAYNRFVLAKTNLTKAEDNLKKQKIAYYTFLIF